MAKKKDKELEVLCRHQSVSCEQCTTECYLLHSSIGRGEGLKMAIEHLKQIGVRAYFDGDDSIASPIRRYIQELEKMVKNQGEVSNNHRKDQGVKGF